MKAINKVCQILALLTGIAALILFFTDFANIVSADVGAFSASGAQLAFASKIDSVGIDMHRSSKLLFCFCVTILTIVFSAASFKSKGAKYATPVSGLVVAIFMLVVTLSYPRKFVDVDAVPNVTAITYTSAVLITTILLFATVILSAAHLFINDYIECAGDKNKLTIPKKVIRFLRDYKSETKKIVWPGIKDVAKNTVIVLIMCAIVGAFIWLLDWGLAELLSLIWG